MYDNQQIVQLQRVKKSKDDHAIFWGKTLKHRKQDVPIKLENAWVQQNFERHPNKDVRDWFKNRVLDPKENKKFLQIPVGNSSFSINEEKNESLKIGSPILYQQKQNHYCVMGSLKACLSFIGDSDAVSDIDDDAMKQCYLAQINNKKPLYFLSQFMQQKLRYASGKHVNKPLKFDPLTECIMDHITVCVLINNIGGKNHAVTIYKNLIFDSSQCYSLELSQKSLDACCQVEFDNHDTSFAATGIKYVGVQAMASFYLSKKRFHKLLHQKKVSK